MARLLSSRPGTVRRRRSRTRPCAADRRRRRWDPGLRSAGHGRPARAPARSRRRLAGSYPPRTPRSAQPPGAALDRGRLPIPAQAAPWRRRGRRRCCPAGRCGTRTAAPRAGRPHAPSRCRRRRGELGEHDGDVRRVERVPPGDGGVVARAVREQPPSHRFACVSVHATRSRLPERHHAGPGNCMPRPAAFPPAPNERDTRKGGRRSTVLRT